MDSKERLPKFDGALKESLQDQKEETKRLHKEVVNIGNLIYKFYNKDAADRRRAVLDRDKERAAIRMLYNGTIDEIGILSKHHQLNRGLEFCANDLVRIRTNLEGILGKLEE